MKTCEEWFFCVVVYFIFHRFSEKKVSSQSINKYPMVLLLFCGTHFVCLRDVKRRWTGCMYEMAAGGRGGSVGGKVDAISFV
jgi:hypothetical protein